MRKIMILALTLVATAPLFTGAAPHQKTVQQ